MLPRTEATIYLANQRGCSQEDWYRSYHTFNFGSYFNESRKAFGSLQVVNDDTLSGGRMLKFNVTENTLILLLPIVGTLNYQTQLEQGSVEVGQCYHVFIQKDSSFEISNPYQSELINFLHVWLTIDSQVLLHDSSFDLLINSNQLIPLPTVKEEQNPIALIGKFDGRKEETYSLRNPDKGIFIFILEGAFEVQNRLLEARDGLAIWNTTEIEFEALSNNAIILVIENQ
jgi:hypothetical protein